MIRIGIVGLGKMGISHCAIVNSHPAAELVGICDSSSYLLNLLGKYTGLHTYSRFDRMLDDADLDALLVATPSQFHTDMVRTALERGLHVFCEKPLTLSFAESNELAALSLDKGLVTQVGYHNRFIRSMREVKALLDAGAIGTVTHALGEAYGPVVLQRKGGTWRSRKAEGGGCLYDYAAHPINLLNWYFGEPLGVGGTVLGKVFSQETDDEVFSTLFFEDGRTAQLSVNWSDPSQRKMTTRVTLWGTAGKIYVDRQECQVYLRDSAPLPEGYEPGWNVRYTTDLTDPVWFYLRGEEYSAQIDHFVRCADRGKTDGINGFADAAATDRVIDMLIADSERGPSTHTRSARRHDQRPMRQKLLRTWGR